MLGKCKSKPQQDIPAHLLEWLLSNTLVIITVSENVEKKELLYTVARNVN